MANEKNLVSLGKRTTSEQREITRKGGIKSGETRRRKRSMREAAELFLSLPVKNADALESLKSNGVKTEDMDNQMAIVAAMTLSAMSGDSRAAKIVMEMIGEAEREEKTDVTREDIESVSSFVSGAVNNADEK